MKTKLFLPIALYLLPFTLLAQGFQWLQHGGGNNTIGTTGNNYFGKEQVIDMATDSERNIYVLSVVTMSNVHVDNNPPIAVTTYEANPNRNDAILISYTCDGTYRWHKVFGGEVATISLVL